MADKKNLPQPTPTAAGDGGAVPDGQANAPATSQANSQVNSQANQANQGDQAALVAEAHAKGFEDGQKAGVLDERERIAAILGSEEAQTRASLAQHLAFATDMSPAEAGSLLAKAAPEIEDSKTGANANGGQGATANGGQGATANDGQGAEGQQGKLAGLMQAEANAIESQAGESLSPDSAAIQQAGALINKETK